MRIELTEASGWTSARNFRLPNLPNCSGLSMPELEELIEYEALAPSNPDASSPVFKAQSLFTARAGCWLRDDFELDPSALVVALLQRIRDLEARLQGLQCRIPGRWR